MADQEWLAGIDLDTAAEKVARSRWTRYIDSFWAQRGFGPTTRERDGWDDPDHTDDRTGFIAKGTDLIAIKDALQEEG